MVVKYVEAQGKAFLKEASDLIREGKAEDVLRHAETARPTVETTPAAPPKSEAVPAGVKVLAFGGMRKRIADNVVKSAFSASHVTLTLEVDILKKGSGALPPMRKKSGRS